MNDSTEKRDVYQIITNRIIAELEQGVVPWQKSWTEAGLPKNLLTMRPYRGINLILLTSLNYEQNYFLTFKQINRLGGHVRRGEKGHMIIFWNITEKENADGEKEKQYFLRYYFVYNISQALGLPKGVLPLPVEEREIDAIASCEQVLSEMPLKPKIVHKENQPYYHTKEDFINMPRKSTFKDNELYYLTLFHEMVHSTGHTTRLNRKELMEHSEYGTELYSIEELTAEIGACYLQSHAGIMREDITNSAAYIQGWLKKLKDDKRFIFHASGQAQKAVDYILNKSVKTPEEEEEKQAVEVF